MTKTFLKQKIRSHGSVFENGVENEVESNQCDQIERFKGVKIFNFSSEIIFGQLF